MKFRRLKNDIEFEAYRHAIAKHIDVLLPLEYLKQGQVYGYFNAHDEVCGGFALITEAPFRVLDSIPNFKGLTIDPELKKTAEITGVWLSQRDKKQFSSLRFWTNIMLKVLLSNKKYFVYAYSSKKEGLAKIYGKANPEVLFRGETIILPGMPSADHESVEVIFKRRIIIQALKNPQFFTKRLFKYNKRKKKEHYEIIENTFLPITSSIVELWPRES